MTQPAVLVSLLALVGSIVTAVSLYKSNLNSTRVDRNKASSDEWNSLVQANKEQLTRIHKDYQLEIEAIVKRFENKIADIEGRAERARLTCENEIEILNKKVAYLERQRDERRI